MIKEILASLLVSGKQRERIALSRALLSFQPADETDKLLRSAVSAEKFEVIFADWTSVLDEMNRFDLAFPWFADAFERGVDPYLAVEIVARIWERRGRASAESACDELAARLPEIAFTRHGEEFHKEMVAKALADLKRVIAYEGGSGETPAAVADRLHDQVRGRIWPRLWQLARMGNRVSICRMALLYPYIHKNDVQQCLHAIEHFLVPYGFWSDVLEALPSLEVTSHLSAHLKVQCDSWRTVANFQENQVAVALASAEAVERCYETSSSGRGRMTPELTQSYLRTLWAHYYWATSKQQLENLEHIQRLTQALCADLATGAIEPRPVVMEAQALLLLAHIAEDLGDVGKAGVLYAEASSWPPDSYLPMPFWRAVNFLSGAGHWPLAVQIMKPAALSLWSHFAALATVAPDKRYEAGEMLPRKAVMLNGDGIGDDLLRIIVTLRFVGFDAPYAFVVDDRLVAPLRRALPTVEFLTRSRGFGRHAVEAAIFHADRIGVPTAIADMGITAEIFEKIEHYGEVCLSEDAIVQYFARAGRFDHDFARPILQSNVKLITQAHDWLATLPSGRLNVGLSWRTGYSEAVRDLNHYCMSELGDLLAVEGVNWIVLQYSVQQAEVELARERFGIDLHVMPGVDLKDDIDQIVALVTELDFVVTTIGTLEHLAGLSGAPVLSLSAGYYSANQYRVGEDGEADPIIPTIRRLTERTYGNKADILSEAARRIRRRELHKRMFARQ